MIDVAAFADLPADRPLAVEAGGEAMILVRVGAAVSAFAATCPHAGAPLAEGAVCDGRVVCPWHKAEFDARTGALLASPALDRLTRYAAEVSDGRVRVGGRLPGPATPRRAGPAEGVLVVGAGAAGTACAAALREFGYDGRLVLAEAEAEAPYDRTVLSKFVAAGDMPAEEAPALREDAFWSAQRIERVRGTVATLDPAARRATLADGTSIGFGAAVLATGGAAKRPDLPGIGLEGVLTLRTRADGAALQEAARRGGRVAIVGGSFVGLEVASGLRKLGLAVSVLMPDALPFASIFGEAVGRALRADHEAAGVVFHRGRLAALLGERRVRAVRSETGEEIAADTVLLGLGIAPRTGLLRGVPIAPDGGLAVDARMRAAPGLWAVGDVARFPFAGRSARVEHWAVAQRQGRVAAADLLGLDAAWSAPPFFWTYQNERRYDYLGHPSGWDEIRLIGDPRAPPFLGLMSQGGRVAAAVACQRERATAALSVRLAHGLTVAEAEALVSTLH